MRWHERLSVTINPAELDILVSLDAERDRIRAAKELASPSPGRTIAAPRLPLVQRRRMDDRVSRWLFEHWYGDRDDRRTAHRSGVGEIDNGPRLSLRWIPGGIHRSAQDLEGRAGEREGLHRRLVSPPHRQNKVKSICARRPGHWRQYERILANRTARDTWTALIAFTGSALPRGQTSPHLAALGVGDEGPTSIPGPAIGPGSLANESAPRPSQGSAAQATRIRKRSSASSCP